MFYKNQEFSSSWIKYVHKLCGDTIYKKIFRGYFLFVILGAIFLFLPGSLQGQSVLKSSYEIDGKNFSFFDSLFTAISAFTNTGLTTHNTVKTFSVLGQIIILILIQVGGIGFLTILVFLWSFATGSKTVNVENRLLLHFERGNNKKSSSLQVVKVGILVLVITEIIGAILLSFFFYFVKPKGLGKDEVDIQSNVIQSIWAGIFHSISATNNAGFDILGTKSIAPYRVGYGNILSVILMIQSFIGGIGYPVFYDLVQWFKNRNKPNRRSLTLFTKISLCMYLVVSYFAIMIAFAIELNNSSYYLMSWGEPDWGNTNFSKLANKTWNLIYLTFSTRSAGFSGIEISTLNNKTQWLLTILMFIGASPASTGGGIRSITLFLILAKIFHTTTGRKYISAFKRSINNNIIEESMLITIFAIFIIVIFSMFIGTTSNMPIQHVLFEASSAFGTAGLTVNISSSTNYIGRFFLLILMFIGQIGISNTLLSWTNSKPSKRNIQYLNEDIGII